MLDLIMQIVIGYIRSISVSSNLMIVVILIVFSILLVYETLHPREKYPTKNLYQSYKTNIGMFIVNTIILSVLSTSSLLLLVDVHSYNGIFNFITNNNVKIIVSFLSLDLLLYYWHRICHEYDRLWMFHRVHHNDSYLNVSTAFRVHFIELFFTNVLKVVFVTIIGINGFILLIHELITILFVMVHHTNVSIKYENILSKLFIGPSLHQTHHSMNREEHDSNYGAIFSFWDRVFGTLLETSTVKIGIKGYSPQSLINLISFGFTTPVIQLKKPTIAIEDMIRVAAYYRAEKRGFIHGNDQYDWFIAERDIHNTIIV